MMNAQTTTGGGSREYVYFYYRCGGRYRSRNGCDHTKQHRAEEIEAKMWRYVQDLMENPEELCAGLERMIELKRKETRGDPERETKAWLDKLAEVERQRARAQDMAIQGLIPFRFVDGIIDPCQKYTIRRQSSRISRNCRISKSATATLTSSSV